MRSIASGSEEKVQISQQLVRELLLTFEAVSLSQMTDPLHAACALEEIVARAAAMALLPTGPKQSFRSAPDGTWTRCRLRPFDRLREAFRLECGGLPR